MRQLSTFPDLIKEKNPYIRANHRLDAFVEVHAMETRGSVLINGQTIDGDSARFRVEQYESELRAAKQRFGHALCLCRTPPLKLVIRQRGDLMHLACWPDDAHQHSPYCSFYTEAYSSAKAEGIVVGQDNSKRPAIPPWLGIGVGCR